MAHYWIQNGFDDLDSLLSYISSAGLPNSNKLKFLFLISDSNLFRIISNYLPEKYTLLQLREDTNLRVYRLTKEIRRRSGEIDEISGIFNIYKITNTNLYAIVTEERNEFAKTILLNFFDNNFFRISKLHFTSKQLEFMLDLLKENLELDKIITERLLSFSRLDGKKAPVGKMPKFRESNIKWTEESYKLSFQSAAENDQWVDNISFYAVKEDKVFFNASLSRDGFFQCSSTNIEYFYNTIIRTVLTIARNNSKIFSKRSRMENRGKVKPIVIKYSYSLFENLEQNSRFINVITKFPLSSISVYHKNPYLHMSLIDYLDGSSYDLWILSNNEIIIVPQLRNTFNSLSRLTEFIFEKFQEGELSELN